MLYTDKKVVFNFDKEKYGMKSNHVLAIGVAIALTVSSLSFSLPKFTASSEQKCNLCHVSPSGGGMRNDFGAQFFAMTELPVHKTEFEQIEKFQTRISDIISLGADMRTLFNYDEATDQASFFQMEGNLHVSAQLDDKFSLTMSKGIYDGFEIYGMGYVLPMQGNFRVGKFQPSYGWRFADHTSFVREKMLWSPGATDTGFELGLFPHKFSINVGLYNGTSGTFDNENSKALSSRVSFRHKIAGIGFGIGGSYWINNHDSGDVTMFGPFGYINLLQGKLIYMGEIDWLKDENVIGKPTREATTNKLSFKLRQGIWLNAGYDFYDPDIDLVTGRVNRYGIGIEYFPYGFLEIQPNLWYYEDDFASDDKYILFNTQMHFFF